MKINQYPIGIAVEFYYYTMFDSNVKTFAAGTIIDAEDGIYTIRDLDNSIHIIDQIDIIGACI